MTPQGRRLTSRRTGIGAMSRKLTIPAIDACPGNCGNEEKIEQLTLNNELLKKQVSILKNGVKEFVSFPEKVDSCDNRTIYLIDDEKIRSVPFGQLIEGRHFVSQI